MNKKTHDRCQPWVFVEIGFSLDKRQRRRDLRRLLPERLVESLTLAGIIAAKVGPSRAQNIKKAPEMVFLGSGLVGRDLGGLDQLPKLGVLLQGFVLLRL